MSTAYTFPTPEDDFKPSKPKVKDIQDLWLQAQRFYSVLKLQQDDNHRYYHLKNSVDTPQGYEQVLPATARTLVNDAADHISSADPRFTMPRAKRTKNAEEQVEQNQRWMGAAWDRLNETKATPVHRTYTVHLIAKGMGAMLVRYIPERMPKKPVSGGKEAEEEYEAKLRMAWPIEWTCHDPRYVFPDPATGGQIWVIEHFMKTVGQVQQMHPEWGGWRDAKGNPKDPNDPVDWYFYTDRYWRAYIAGTEFVTFSRQVPPGPVPHGLGFVPWVIRSAGLADDSGLPDERYQSMLYIVRSLLDEEARVWTQGQSILKDYAWPWTLVPHGAKVDPGSRKINEVPPEVIKGVQQMRPDAQAPKAVLEWIDMVGAAIERATYSSVVTGRAPQGQRSGYSVAVLAGMARVKFQPIKTNVESAMAEAMRKTLLLIENKVKGKVKIYAGASTDYELGPDDIRGYERVDCEIEAQLVQDIAADADIGQRAFQIGMSLETVLKRFYHVDNPQEEIERRYVEDLLQQPAVKALMTVLLGRRQGLDPQLIQVFMEATGMVQPGSSQPQGQTSPGGTPPAPSTGQEGGVAPGTPAPPGTPSVPLSGPTSPLGPQGSALAEVGRLPGQFRRAGFLGSGIPLG